MAVKASEWDEISFDAGVTRKARVMVQVPPPVFLLVSKAREEGLRPVKAYRDAADYQRVSDIFYSAGVKLDPPATVTVQPGVLVDGKFVRVDEVSQGTHLRATVGAKRGGKSKNDAATPAA